jgi:hypothetical protein
MEDEMRVVGGFAASAMIFAVLCGAATGMDKQAAPLDIIRQLNDRMYVVGETSGRLEDFQSAVADARKELEGYASSGGDPAGFVQKDKENNGATPLIAAASAGYSDIVAELLKNERVVASVNDADRDGISPWAFANFALNEAIWVCNPTVFNDPFSYVPSFVKLPYYLGGTERPYAKTRRVLEAAGAKSDMAAARRLWLKTCKLATPESRQKVAQSQDLLTTIEAESERVVAALNADADKDPAQ